MDFFRVLKKYGRRKKPGNHRLIRPSLQFFLFLTLALTLPSGVLAQSSTPPPACSVAQQSSGLVAVTFNPNYGSGAITNQCAAQGVTFACGTGACSFEPYGGTQAEVGGGAVGAPMSVTFVNPSAPSEPAAPVSVSFDVQYITAPASPICCGSAAAAPAAAKQMRVTYYDLNGKVIATQSQAIGNQVGYSFHFSFSPTTGPGVHSYAISLVGGPFTIAPFFFLKDLAYQPKYALQATNQTPHLLIKGKPPTPEIAYLGTSAAKTAHLTLGGTYRIGFGMVTPISSGKKRAFHPISSKFTLGKAHLKNQGDFDSSALFPSGAVIRYVDEYKGADGKSAGEVVLQAVHLGTQTLTITPKSKDSTVKRVKVTVSVLAPATLGTTHLKLDRRLIKLASDTGVPPQMIKGQIAQEGEFNPMAWRYEPFNLTTGDFAFSRKPHDLRTVPPRSLFRLPTIGDITDPGNCHRTKGKGKKRPKGKKFPYDYGLYIDQRIPQPNCLGLPIGADFSPQAMTAIANTKYKIIIPDRDPKTGNILINPKTKEPITRDLKASDRYVSVHDIVAYNNAIYHWSMQGVPRSRFTEVETGATDFTAQLTLAASYGFLQVTYEKAIEENWQGDTANCGPSNRLDPDNLFDTSCNLAHGGGSLGLGTHIVAQNYIGRSSAKRRGLGLTDEQTFMSLLHDAYQAYDHQKVGYGYSVLRHAINFEPMPKDSIFLTGGQQ